jgi:hypothetical protein
VEAQAPVTRVTIKIRRIGSLRTAPT